MLSVFVGHPELCGLYTWRTADALPTARIVGSEAEELKPSNMMENRCSWAAGRLLQTDGGYVGDRVVEKGKGTSHARRGAWPGRRGTSAVTGKQVSQYRQVGSWAGRSIGQLPLNWGVGTLCRGDTI